MTYPHMPPGPAYGPSPIPPTMPARPRTAAERLRVADIVLTTVSVLGLFLATLFAGFAILFSPMVLDSCYADCDTGDIGAAWATMVYAVPVAWLFAIIGVVWTAIKRQFMFIWPLLGCVAIVAVTVIATQIMEDAARL